MKKFLISSSKIIGIIIILSMTVFSIDAQTSGKYLPPITAGSQFVNAVIYDSAMWVKPDGNTVIVSGHAIVIASKSTPNNVALHFTLPFPVVGNPAYPIGGGVPITSLLVGFGNSIDSLGNTFGAAIRFNPGHQPIMIWRPLYKGTQSVNYSYTYTIQ